MNKRAIINFLFIVSFPIYGIGTYISAVKSPSLGYIVSISAPLLIVAFYAIDLLYKRQFTIKINFTYLLMLVYIVSTCISLFIALGNGLPEATSSLTITKSLLLITPFHAFIIVVLYNKNNEDQLPRLTILSLSLLLLINLLGFFGLGLTNEVHSIEGRLNFPFLDGFYSGASLLAIINLLLLRYLNGAWTNPLKFFSLGAFFIFNMGLFFWINSRLAILILFLVFTLILFKAIRVKGLYALSMCTIPILLSSGMLLYGFLQLPGVSSVFQRVDVEDVTTFNGRSYIWQDAVDWLMYDQEGLWFGNGYKGHYFLGLLSDVAKLWNVKETHHLHLHSTSLEILVCQGVIFYSIFCLLLYKIYMFYKRKHQSSVEEGVFFPVVVFLLFILQVDTFLYDDGLGFVIFSLLASRAAITEKVDLKAGIQLKNYEVALPYSNRVFLAHSANGLSSNN